MVFEPQKTDKREAPESQRMTARDCGWGTGDLTKDHGAPMAVTALVYIWYGSTVMDV